MDSSYQSIEQVNVDAILDSDDPWDDPAIGTYLERSQQAEQDRIERELARINDQLAARDTLYDDIMAELRWQVEMYERELNRLVTRCTATTEARDRVSSRLCDLRQEIRDDHRQHWQDRQQLARECRELRRERAALCDDDLSALL